MENNLTFKECIRSQEDRRFIARFIQQDINYLKVFHKNNANWEVTNRYDIGRIRINVGKCYILDILQEELRIPVYKHRLPKEFINQHENKLDLIRFDVIEKGAYEFVCDPQFLRENESKIRNAHREYLDEVVQTSAKSPYIQSYCPEIINEINEEFNLKIAHPDYYEEEAHETQRDNHQTLSKEEYERIKGILLSKRWIFAKTMPEHPHWYTLRKEWESDEEFVDIVKAIREYGYQEKFYSKYYTCLNVENMKYWTMGAPVNETILINRAYIKK